MTESFWDIRYGKKEYVYGKEPNAFFRETIKNHKPGRILVPGAGEGRDAVYAATRMWTVDAFDMSRMGRQKALALAKEFHVNINYSITDAGLFKSPGAIYDAIGLTYFHLPENIREHFHKELVKSLKPGAILFLEAFTPKQLENNSGGPKDKAMLLTPEIVMNDFKGLTKERLDELEVVLQEGEFHNGKANIIRYIGINNNLN